MTDVATRSRTGWMGPEHVRMLERLFGTVKVTAVVDTTIALDSSNTFVELTGTLAANRALSFTGVGWAVITRTGGGAFTWTAAGKAMATGTWAIIASDGTTPYLAAYGSL